MPPTADVRDLLVHADWLRRLAGQLLRYEGDVGDLVQQTWVAALRSPPDGYRPARPWLAEVLRNFARKARRQQRTRDWREEEQQRRQGGRARFGIGTASAETLLAAAQLQRVLAELVVMLEEPYRTTILLRFYRDRTEEIAQATGVPAGTVRWRVNEAIRRLRASLDSREGGPDWRRALLPLVSTSAPLSSALKGALLIMSTKAKLGVAAGIVTALATGAWFWSARPSETSSQSAALVSAEPPANAEAALARARGAAGRAASDRAGARVPGPGHPPRLIVSPAGSAPEATRAPSGGDRGSMDKDQIRRAVRQVIPIVKECYAKLLEDQPEASGRLVVRFTITNAGGGVGRIKEASIVPKEADGSAPELISPLTEQCVLNAIGNLSFPAPEGEPVDVTYPFNFSPRGGVIPGAVR